MKEKNQSSLLQKIKPHGFLLIGMGLLIVVVIYLIAETPQIPEWETIKNTYALFSLALQATLINLTIGIYLLYRWNSTHKENISTRNWGIAFLLNCIFLLHNYFKPKGSHGQI